MKQLRLIARLSLFVAVTYSISLCVKGQNPQPPGPTRPGGNGPMPTTGSVESGGGDNQNGEIYVGAKYGVPIDGTRQTWNLKVARGDRTQIALIDMNIASSTNCQAAYLECTPVIHTGSESQMATHLTQPNQTFYTNPVKVCGSRDSRPKKLLIFDSDEVNIVLDPKGDTDAHLFLRYQSLEPLRQGACYHNITTQRITSENYDNHLFYPNSTYCDWHLTVGRGKIIELFFTAVHLEYSGPNCVYDKIVLYDGPNKTSNKIATLCGYSSGTYYSTSNQMYVTFESDASVGNYGFAAFYGGVPGNTPLTSIEGVYSFRGSNESIICSTQNGCRPSFQRSIQGVNIYVFDITAPIGKQISLSWSGSVADKEIALNVYDVFYDWTHPKKYADREYLLLNEFEGNLLSNDFKITLALMIPNAIEFMFQLSYSTFWDESEVRNEAICHSEQSKYNVLSNLPLLISVKSKADAVTYCTWIFKALHPEKYLKLDITNVMSSSVNSEDCMIEGFSVFDGPTPTSLYKHYGPFCGFNKLHSIVSTGQYMVVVFHKHATNTNERSSQEQETFQAIVQQTNCIGIFSDNTEIQDVTSHPCFTLQHIRSRRRMDTTVEFPINLTNEIIAQFQIDLNNGVSLSSETGLECEAKQHCSEFYVQDSNLPVCDIRELTFIPKIQSSCAYASRSSIIPVVNSSSSTPCQQMRCTNNVNWNPSDVQCGLYYDYISGPVNPLRSPTYCKITLDNRHSNCLRRSSGLTSQPVVFTRYILRFRHFESNGAELPEVKELVYEDPCRDKKFKEHKHYLSRLYDPTYVYYTIGSDHIEISHRFINSFAIEYEEIIIPDPLTYSVSSTKFCPEKYVLRGEYCYAQREAMADSENKYTWVDADDDCEEQGGDLVSITGEEELTFIKQMLMTHWAGNVFQEPFMALFIGLRGEGFDLKWTDGSTVSFTDWHTPLYANSQTYAYLSIPQTLNLIIPAAKLQPTLDPDSLCAVMYLDGPSIQLTDSTHWAKLPCKYPIANVHHICKMPAKPAVDSTTVTSDNVEFGLKDYGFTCPSGWTYILGKCMRMESTTLSLLESMGYELAVETCTHLNGTVAEISNDKMDTLKKYLQLWKHRFVYRGIWVRKQNGRCRVINPLSDRWELSRRKLYGETNEITTYEIAEWSCGINDSPFRMEGQGIDLPEQIVVLINQTYWDSFKETEEKNFPNGPRSVLCQREITIHTVQRCAAQQYQCKDKSCIYQSSVCDGRQDCLGGEDEQDCECSKDFFRCADGTCIPHSLYCDFIEHCKDGSDESSCKKPVCGPDEFRCDNGRCISMNYTCDFFPNCANGEDESGRLCNWKDTCEYRGFQCYTEICIPKSRVKDIHPDCTTFTTEDEQLDITETYRGTYKIRETIGENYAVYADYSPYCENTDESQCLPGHTHCFQRSKACVYNLDEHDPRTIIDSCRDFSHLQGCSEFECPGMFKCLNSYCVPMKRVCDNRQDCPNGEDEKNCEEYVCPGSFRCPNSSICIEQSQVCDGNFDCSQSGEDESYCDLPEKCPSSCSCNGYSVSCENNNLTNIPAYSKNLRALFFTGNALDFTNKTFLGYYFLGKLNLSKNGLTTIPAYAFKDLVNLYELDLSGNVIGHLVAYHFFGLSLQLLNLSTNVISSIDVDAFSGLTKSDVLDLENNDQNLFINEQSFSNLSMQEIRTDAFRFCCIVQNLQKNVTCTPAPDEFSSCDSLLSNEFLQYGIWVVGILAFIGNIAVFVWRIKTERQNVSSFLILNLSVSDFLMGVYLLIIASADVYYEYTGGNYYLYDESWREGVVCQIEGFLSTLACEMSVFILVVITIDRVIALLFTFEAQSLNKRRAAIVMGIGWVVWSVVALVPIWTVGPLYYGKTSVCLPFTLSNAKTSGWVFSAVVFLGFNLLAFIVIAIGYIAIFWYARRQRSKSKRKASARDMALARRVVLIILTDFCCWIPIIILGILSLSGVSIGNNVSAWIAVFVMPINSALNPILYTFASVNITCCQQIINSSTDSHANANSPAAGRKNQINNGKAKKTSYRPLANDYTVSTAASTPVDSPAPTKKKLEEMQTKEQNGVVNEAFDDTDAIKINIVHLNEADTDVDSNETLSKINRQSRTNSDTWCPTPDYNESVTGENDMEMTDVETGPRIRNDSISGNDDVEKEDENETDENSSSEDEDNSELNITVNNKPLNMEDLEKEIVTPTGNYSKQDENETKHFFIDTLSDDSGHVEKETDEPSELSNIRYRNDGRSVIRVSGQPHLES